MATPDAPAPAAASTPAGTIQVRFNDATLELPAGCTVAALLERQGLAGRRVAVEVNREIVPRSAHGDRTLESGDSVEVVHALGGG